VFNQALNALTNVDNILDFSVVDDRILLSHLVFTTLGPAGTLPSGEFSIGSSAGDADDRIIYNSSTGALSYDSDGTGAAASVQFAHLTPGLAMTSSDFRVV
jgi:Ca2+-binding RTX toxin-like protein